MFRASRHRASLDNSARRKAAAGAARALLVALFLAGVAPVRAADPIDIPDPNLEAAIREAAGVAQGPIFEDDLSTLTLLAAENAGVADLTGIEHCGALAFLYLYGNSVTDLSPVTDLTTLTVLDIGRNQIADLSPLSGLSNLRTLEAAKNPVADLSPLAGLSGLEEICLSEAATSDIAPLANLTNLRELEVSECGLVDLAPLAGLSLLEGLDLRENAIVELGPLAGLGRLEYLDIGVNEVASLQPLAGLTTLTVLSFGVNDVVDISPLAGMTRMRDLDLYSNDVVDISPVRNMTSLTRMLMYGNEIEDLSPLNGKQELVDLFASQNRISDLAPLADLPAIEQLLVSSNRIASIEPLLDCAGLDAGDRVRLDGNPLTCDAVTSQIPALEARGVIVEGGVFCMTGVAPSRVPDDGVTSLTFEGDGFQTTPTITLRHVGGGSWIYETDVLSVTNERLIASFNFANRLPGLYDATVTNPDGSKGMMIDAVEVYEPVGPMELIAYLLGRADLSQGQRREADANDDGIIDIGDAIAMIANMQGARADCAARRTGQP